MVNAKITVYGTEWCSDCHRAKTVLERHQVAYDWIDVDKDADSREYVLQINGGRRIVPTIVFEDGSILVEPSDAELATKLTTGTRTP